MLLDDVVGTVSRLDHLLPGIIVVAGDVPIAGVRHALLDSTPDAVVGQGGTRAPSVKVPFVARYSRAPAQTRRITWWQPGPKGIENAVWSPGSGQ